METLLKKVTGFAEDIESKKGCSDGCADDDWSVSCDSVCAELLQIHTAARELFHLHIIMGAEEDDAAAASARE